MMIFKKFRATDFLEVSVQPVVESGMGVPFTVPDLQVLQGLVGNSWTGHLGALAVACGGTIEVWPKRHLAWCYLTRPAVPHLRRITRLAAEITALPEGRVEATVRADFPRGHRWMEMLGFEVETPLLKRYGPYGEDHVGYVRFNDVIRTDCIQGD